MKIKSKKKWEYNETSGIWEGLQRRVGSELVTGLGTGEAFINEESDECIGRYLEIMVFTVHCSIDK